MPRELLKGSNGNRRSCEWQRTTRSRHKQDGPEAVVQKSKAETPSTSMADSGTVGLGRLEAISQRLATAPGFLQLSVLDDRIPPVGDDRPWPLATVETRPLVVVQINAPGQPFSLVSAQATELPRLSGRLCDSRGGEFDG